MFDLQILCLEPFQYFTCTYHTGRKFCWIKVEKSQNKTLIHWFFQPYQKVRYVSREQEKEEVEKEEFDLTAKGHQ